MTAIEPGQSVRTLMELHTPDGSLIAPGSRGIVIGYEGNRLIVEFTDSDGETATMTVDVWTVRR